MVSVSVRNRSVRIPLIAKNLTKIWNSSGIFFFILFITKYYIIFLSWISRSINFIFGIIILKNIVYEFVSFENIWKILHALFCADIARLLQYFNNISDRFRNILVILQYFQEIFLQYCLNISVLCVMLIV